MKKTFNELYKVSEAIIRDTKGISIETLNVSDCIHLFFSSRT